VSQDEAAFALLDDPAMIGSASDELLPRDEFLRVIGAANTKASSVLRVLLARCQVGAPLTEQLFAIEQLGRYIVAGPNVASETHPALVRLEWLVIALEQLPAARQRFQAALEEVLEATRGIKLLGEIGLPNDRGLLAETSDRLTRQLLPEPPATHELWRLAGHIVHDLDDLSWLGPAADPLLNRLAAVGGDAWRPLRSVMLDVVGLLTTRIAALGMSEVLRTRTELDTLRGSPLFRLTRAGLPEMPELIAASRAHLEQVRAALEDHGVSIEVVYSLDAIERSMARLELVLPFVAGDRGAVALDNPAVRELLGSVGRGLVGGLSFRQLVNDNLRLLARKVIERAGRSGEQYVTSSRREYWTMLGSATGGGVIMLGAAISKFFVQWGSFAPFLDGVLSSMTYAGAFVLMQLVGFTLATKQPSMTAAALAGTIRRSAGPDRLDALVPLIARITRSQLAAALGNVAGAIAAALGFGFLWQHVIGSPFLDPAAAKATVASFDPLHSSTILYAVLTGVLLWLSSLCAGWFENWFVFRRLPEAIEHHRYGRRVGRKRMARLARFMEREAAGFGGSVSLGCLLGMVPALGRFFGVAIGIRHITLSTGALTLAISSLGVDGVASDQLISALAGIAVIGVLNFGVSFALALFVALRARDVGGGEGVRLSGAVLRRFVRRPFEFVYPPREADAGRAASHQ
jgi:site-specific recombinase